MLLLLLCSLFSLVLALPVVSPVPRDVWAPPIIYPDASAVWLAGATYTVTWNVSSQPTQVTNPKGMVYLRHDNATQSSPIAQDFLLSAGQVNVTVPADTLPDTNWIVVLFGDSGNWSPKFTILAQSS